ncbi:ABC transporter ATP-binding protein [Raineyella sp. W15-4]|uniref:ABC transporter ATP-binding protein n=1 Tax=Raineyella sp. W15-4 TaxID=3081651 RepID=UPI0029542CE5|nr:ABC transporter ATP-binding protein [Raineyella sp. W15-4]WOQ16423.1 ABC transporter ATP-binding protein [Raineyella sp. W15-4]
MKYRHQLGVLFSPRARWQLALSVLGSILVSVAESVAVLLVVPLIQLMSGGDITSGMLQSVAGILGVTDRGNLQTILLVLVVSGFVLKDVATMFFRWWMLGFINREQAETSAKLLEYYLRLPYLEFQRTTSAEKFRVTGTSVNFAYSRFVLGVVSALTEAVTILAITTALLIAAPLPTLVLIAYFGAAALIFLRVFKPQVEEATERAIDAAEKGLRASFHAVFGIKEIKLRASYARFISRYRHEMDRSAQAARVSTYLGELPKYILEILFIAGVGIAIAAAGATNAAGGTMSMLALLAAGAFRILPSITRMLASVNNMQGGEVALHQVTRLLWDERRNITLERIESPAAPLSFTRQLEIRNVSFRYGAGLPLVLDDVSLAIPHGSSIALVGASGAGKSTLVDLLLGFLEPTSGAIVVDNAMVTSETRASWQRIAAMVPQSVYLIDGTLRENIAFDQDLADVDEARLRRALSLAQLDDVVADLPHGLDEQIGEQGGRLSGGQRQRIGIARAIYRGPKFLVLDEATSALDNETERKITETITSLHGEVTVVIVAHRLSTVKHADQLAFFEDGRITGLGTFEEVQQQNAKFAHLVDLGSLSPATPVES